MDPPTAVDPTTFRELQDATGAEFVASLVATFMDEAPELLTQLREAQAAGVTERFRRAAHSLKSNALTFGASAMAMQARALEAGSLPGDLSGVDALDAELGRVMAALKELCNG